MSSTPHMKWFPDAALADTAMLSLEEAGAYRILLDHMWLNEGSLPDNDERIARLLRVSKKKWKKIRKALTGFLIFEAGEIKNKRLSREFLDAKSLSQTNSINGKSGGIKSGEKRNKNNKTTQANGSDSLKRNESEPSSEIQASITITNTIEEGGGVTRANTPIWNTEFYRKLETLVGWVKPPSALDLEAWFRTGADESLILETVEHVMKTSLQGIPPGSITYFDNPIARAVARRDRTIDIPTVGENYAGKSSYNHEKPSRYMSGIAGLFEDTGGGVHSVAGMAEDQPGTPTGPDGDDTKP